jgi:hypothetical protein
MTLCRVLSLLAGLVSTPTPALQFYHITNIHNNENTCQVAHSAYAMTAMARIQAMADGHAFGRSSNGVMLHQIRSCVQFLDIWIAQQWNAPY